MKNRILAFAAVVAAMAFSHGASQAQQLPTATATNNTPAPGQVKSTGKCEDGGGYTFRAQIIDVGKYETKNIGGVFKQVWVSFVAAPATSNNKTETVTFSVLPGGVACQTRVLGYFAWTGPGMPPGGQAGMNKTVEALGQPVTPYLGVRNGENKKRCLYFGRVARGSRHYCNSDRADIARHPEGACRGGTHSNGQ